jgi:hypothetical protein
METMKRTAIDLSDRTEAEFGYKANIIKQEYTHVFSNYYTTPKINLSQLRKNSLLFSAEISQTEISDYFKSACDYTTCDESMYFKTTPFPTFFQSVVS